MAILQHSGMAMPQSSHRGRGSLRARLPRRRPRRRAGRAVRVVLAWCWLGRTSPHRNPVSSRKSPRAPKPPVPSHRRRPSQSCRQRTGDTACLPLMIPTRRLPQAERQPPALLPCGSPPSLHRCSESAPCFGRRHRKSELLLVRHMPRHRRRSLRRSPARTSSRTRIIARAGNTRSSSISHGRNTRSRPARSRRQ